MASQLEKLESVLDESLNKKAPFKLPESSRKSLAGALWWLALVGGVAQLYLAWNLWDDWHRVDQLLNYTNALAEAYGIGGTSNTGHSAGNAKAGPASSRLAMCGPGLRSRHISRYPSYRVSEPWWQS